MHEFLKLRIIAASTLLMLGCAACTSSPENSHSDTSQKATTKTGSKSALELPKIEVKYIKPGYRELIMTSLNRAGLLDTNMGVYDNGSYAGESDLTTIFQFCDNGDLVEETKGWTDQGDNSGSISSSISRTVGYPACADGRLTPSDFKHGSAVETH